MYHCNACEADRVIYLAALKELLCCACGTRFSEVKENCHYPIGSFEFEESIDEERGEVSFSSLFPEIIDFV